MAAKKKPAAKRSAKTDPGPAVEAGAMPERDESQERNLKVDGQQGVEHEPPRDEGNSADESQERNERVDEIVEAEAGPAVDMRTERDGAAEDEDVDLPVVRVGELWESMDPRDDDNGGGRRRVRVVDTDEDGKVRVENLVTGRVSHIDRDRFVPPHWNRQFS